MRSPFGVSPNTGRGLAETFENVKEFVEKKLEPGTYERLVETLKHYNEAAAAGKDMYGKVTFPTLFKPEERIRIVSDISVRVVSNRNA